jgi:hypothetical protein
MSGVELAGLVLGALPVAVAALELYKTKIGPLFFTIRRDYLKDLRALEFHQLEITHCLGKLLLPMLRDKTELEQLIASPSDEQWNEKIHPALEARLGQNYYPTFVKVVSDINQVLEELKSKLVVGDDDIQAQLKREVVSLLTLLLCHCGLTADNTLTCASHQSQLSKIRSQADIIYNELRENT